MTKKELSRMIYLKQEIIELQNEIARLEAIANGTTTQLTGAPGTPGKKDKLGNVMAELLDAKEILETKKQKQAYELARIDRYIASIDDPLISLVIKYKYAETLEWNKVAGKIGGGNTVGGLKQQLHRYLKKH